MSAGVPEGDENEGDENERNENSGYRSMQSNLVNWGDEELKFQNFRIFQEIC